MPAAVLCSLGPTHELTSEVSNSFPEQSHACSESVGAKNYLQTTKLTRIPSILQDSWTRIASNVLKSPHKQDGTEKRIQVSPFRNF